MQIRRLIEKLMPTEIYSEEDRALRRFVLSLLVVGQPVLLICAILWSAVGFHLGTITVLSMFFAQIVLIILVRLGQSPLVVAHLFSACAFVALMVMSLASDGIRSPLCAWLFIPVINAFWIAGTVAGILWASLAVVGLILLWAAGTSSSPFIQVLPGHLLGFVSLVSCVGMICYFSLVAVVYHRWRREGMTAAKSLMEQRQHLVSVLGHDLKNPVAGLLGRVYLVERELGKGNTVDLRQILVFVREEGSKILESIDRLLLLNRSKMVMEVPMMRNLDLRALIESVIAEHHSWMRSKDIKADFSSIVAQRVYGDAAMLSRLFDNILTNAVKYSHAGSTVRFDATPRHESNRSMVEVTIADQGVGMDPREADQFFKLEYRPNKPTAGESSSGVGASIMREIVAAHDGRIWLTTGGKDQGTAVHVLLRAPHVRKSQSFSDSIENKLTR